MTDKRNAPVGTGANRQSNLQDGESSGQSTDLDRARALADAGVPIFMAMPALGDGQWDPAGGHGGCGYWLPKDWQHTEADPAVLDRYQPGMAVGAVMGHGLDLLDVDPRSGGADTMAGLMEAETWPTAYGEAATPSGGSHTFIRSTGVRSRDAVRPGFDVKAGDPAGEGRGFAFIAPTVRRSKVDGELRAYTWTDLSLDRLAEDGPTDDSGLAIADMVRDAHNGTQNGARATNGAAGTGSTRELFADALGPWDGIPELLAKGRNTGVFALASALRGRGGWRLADVISYMRLAVWPLIDQQQSGHPYTVEEFEKSITGVFTRYTDGPSNNGAAAGQQQHTNAKMTARRASDMPDPPPTKWLALGWLPHSAVTVLCGDEGIGKSLLWVLIAACVTTGRAMPEVGLPARDPGDVVIVITEDSWSEVRSRLLLAEADLTRVHVISEDADGTGAPVFPADMDVIAELAERVDPVLIVLDAWLDTVSSRTSVKDPQQAASALLPWRETANRFTCSVLLVTHTNRMSDASTRDRVGGTGALRSKARMLLFAAAEKDGEGAQLYVGPDKANSTGWRNAVRFDISVTQVRKRTLDDPGTVATLGRPVEQDRIISALIDQWRAAEREAKKPPSADQRAEAWLRAYMTDAGGQAEVAVVQAAAAAEGHTARRITAVIKSMGGQSKPLDGGGPWVFILPTC